MCDKGDDALEIGTLGEGPQGSMDGRVYSDIRGTFITDSRSDAMKNTSSDNSRHWGDLEKLRRDCEVKYSHLKFSQSQTFACLAESNDVVHAQAKRDSLAVFRPIEAMAYQVQQSALNANVVFEASCSNILDAQHRMVDLAECLEKTHLLTSRIQSVSKTTNNIPDSIACSKKIHQETA